MRWEEVWQKRYKDGKYIYRDKWLPVRFGFYILMIWGLLVALNLSDGYAPLRKFHLFLIPGVILALLGWRIYWEGKNNKPGILSVLQGSHYAIAFIGVAVTAFITALIWITTAFPSGTNGLLGPNKLTYWKDVWVLLPIAAIIYIPLVESVSGYNYRNKFDLVVFTIILWGTVFAFPAVKWRSIGLAQFSGNSFRECIDYIFSFTGWPLCVFLGFLGAVILYAKCLGEDEDD